MAYFEVRGLSKRYGTVRALHGASLVAERDEIVCVIGPSGSGKSTLLNILAGAISADSGDVMLNGRSMLRLPPFRRRLALVPQDFLLFPHLNVNENVAFPLRVRRESEHDTKSVVDGCLDQLNISDLRRRMPSELSGGQAQRVAIARALAMRPDAVLMDEPLAHVEPSLRRNLERLLVDTQRNWRVPFIIVTHLQEEALAIADRLVVLREGAVVQQGATRDVYNTPRERFVAAFLGASTSIEARAVRREGSHVVCATPFGELRCEDAQIQEGDGVFLCFRADAVCLHKPLGSAGLSAPNLFEGVVTRTVFRGRYSDIEIAPIGDANIRIETSCLGEPTISQGEQISWSVAPNRVLRLRA